MSRFVDKFQAAGMVYCLEQHFKRITAHLDACNIPKEDKGIPLTVEQRILVLIEFANRPGSRERYEEGISESLILARECNESWKDFERECPEEIEEKVSDWFEKDPNEDDAENYRKIKRLVDFDKYGLSLRKYDDGKYRMHMGKNPYHHGRPTLELAIAAISESGKFILNQEEREMEGDE